MSELTRQKIRSDAVDPNPPCVPHDHGVLAINTSPDKRAEKSVLHPVYSGTSQAASRQGSSLLSQYLDLVMIGHRQCTE